MDCGGEVRPNRRCTSLGCPTPQCSPLERTEIGRQNNGMAQQGLSLPLLTRNRSPMFFIDLHLLEPTMNEGNYPLRLLQELRYGGPCDTLPDPPPSSFLSN